MLALAEFFIVSFSVERHFTPFAKYFTDHAERGGIYLIVERRHCSAKIKQCDNILSLYEGKECFCLKFLHKKMRTYTPCRAVCPRVISGSNGVVIFCSDGVVMV